MYRLQILQWSLKGLYYHRHASLLGPLTQVNFSSAIAYVLSLPQLSVHYIYLFHKQYAPVGL